MKSYWLVPSKGALALEARDVDQPTPGKGQILVKVQAAGLNRGELLPSGAMATTAAKAGGGECSGIVESTGPDTGGFSKGMKVMGRCAGAFADYALMDVREAFEMPASLSWEQAASVPLTFAVAYDMLFEQGGIAEGSSVLVAGITSGVGVAVLQSAKAVGAKVIGTSGSKAKLERLKPLGLDLGIATRAPDFSQQILDATDGRGVDIAINAVGGSVFGELLRSLAFQGRLAIVGYVDGRLTSDIDLELLHRKRLRVYGVSNRLRTPEQRAASIRGMARDVLPAIADGRIVPLIDRVFPMAAIAEAKAYMESDAHVGKIVVRNAG